MNKTTSLAIDALTQFRAGVEKVRINNFELSAEKAFALARYQGYLTQNSNDEENVIQAIENYIIDHITVKNVTPKEYDNLSVEVVV